MEACTMCTVHFLTLLCCCVMRLPVLLVIALSFGHAFACDITFNVPSSINATVNSTVVLKCTSPCTPLRIIHAHGHSQESQLGKETKDQNNSYIVNITVKLNATFNNTIIFCRTYSSTRAVTSNNLSVIIQDYLRPASDLKFAVSNNRLVFSWSGPSVLKGIKLMYNVQFSLAGDNKTSWANISTSNYSTALVNPCLEGRFSVTPTADTLTGKTQTLTQHFPKDAPVIKYVKEKFIREGQTIIIALQYLVFSLASLSNNIPTVDCYGEVHTGGKLFTWCQYSKRHNNYSISNPRDNINGRAVPVRIRHDIKLSAHDFCLVNVTLQYGAGQIIGSQQTINISLFDTQSIKIQANSSALTICILCQFANWAIVQGCSIKLDFYYKEGHNSTHAVAFRNHTQEAKHCFRNLAFGEYTVRVSVRDYDHHNDSVSHHVAVMSQTVVEFSPTHPPTAEVNTLALWPSLAAVVLIVIVGAIICLTILFCVQLWRKKGQAAGVSLQSPTSQRMERVGSYESKDSESCTGLADTTESDKRQSLGTDDSVEFFIPQEGVEESSKENTSHFVPPECNSTVATSAIVHHQMSYQSSTCDSFTTCKSSLESSYHTTEDTELPYNEPVNQQSMADNVSPNGNTSNQPSDADDSESLRLRRIPTVTLLPDQEEPGNQ